VWDGDKTTDKWWEGVKEVEGRRERNVISITGPQEEINTRKHKHVGDLN
jgi:hypothetical protein